MALTAGTRIGPYTVTAPLGEGGMGIVFRAHDTKLQRDVALKLLPEHFADDADRLLRFQREAQVLASLNHPNIAQIYGLEESSSTRCIVMELVEGQTLQERLKRGPIPLEEALPIAAQIATALEAAHERGIVHRDLKPANIKLTPDGRVKVLDFGLAKAFQQEQSPALSNSPTLMDASVPGVILGTAAYMSPEQAKGKEADRSSDTWAFGCVLYEMLTAHAAFEGETIGEILAGVFKAEPDWGRLPAETPEAIRRLLRRCLQKDRNRRVNSANDARIEIEEALSTPPAEAVPRAVRTRRTLLPWIVAAITTLVFAPIAILHIREKPTAEPPEMRLEIPTPSTSAPLEFALSPDGRYLVFVASADGPQRLWLRALDKTDAQPIAGTEGADYPVTVTRLDPRRQGQHVFPQFLPDGRHFLFYVVGTPEGSGIYLGSLDGGEPKRLAAANSTGAYLAPGMIAFVRQTTLIAQRLDLNRGELVGDPVRLADPVSVSEVGVTGFSSFSISADGRVAYRSGVGWMAQLKWHDRTGKAVSVVGQPDSSLLQYPALLPDGTHVAVNRTIQNNLDIWQIDLVRDRMTRFTFDPGVDIVPIWSPDGMRIVFSSARKGPFSLYVKSASGASAEELLFETPKNTYAQDWSGNGQFLLYSDTDPKTGRDLWALPMSGTDRKPIEVVRTPFEELNGQFSPDARWVAYETNESGRFEIVVQPFPVPTGKWQVSTGGGIQPRWRADGKELYFIAPDGKLMAASITAAGATFSTGTPVPLFPVGLVPGLGANNQQYAVSRDGRFLINQRVETSTTAPITLLLNWKPEP